MLQLGKCQTCRRGNHTSYEADLFLVTQFLSISSTQCQGLSANILENFFFFYLEHLTSVHDRTINFKWNKQLLGAHVRPGIHVTFKIDMQKKPSFLIIWQRLWYEANLQFM